MKDSLQLYEKVFEEIVTLNTHINKLQIIPIIYNSSQRQFKILTKLNRNGVNERLFESTSKYSTFAKDEYGRNLFELVSKLFYDILLEVPNPKYIVDINIEMKTNTLTLYYFLPKVNENKIAKYSEYNWVRIDNISNSASVSTELNKMKLNILKAIALSKIRML